MIVRPGTAYQKLAVKLFQISIIIGCVVSFVSLMPQLWRDLLYISSALSGFAGLVVYFFDLENKEKNNKAFTIWVLIALYMLFVGVFFGRYSIMANFGLFLSQDVRFVMYIAIGFAFADKDYYDEYIKTMHFVACFGVIACLIGLMQYGFDLSALSRGDRIGIWSFPYYCWWIVGAVYIFVAVNTKATDRYKLVSYATFALYFVFGVLFLKRSAIFNSVLLFLFLSFAKKEPVDSKKSNRFVFSLIAIAIAFLLIDIGLFKNTYFGTAIDQTFNRLESTDVLDYDRTREVEVIFSSSSSSSLFFGRGLGNYLVMNGNPINAVHIGFYDIIYKGGIVYLLFWIYVIIKTVKCFFARQRLGNDVHVASIVMLLMIISMAYEGSFTYTISPIGFAASMAIIINEKGVKV